MSENIRVGAFLSIDDDNKQVEFLGYGELIGYETPDENARGVAPIVRALGQLNPKILLDNGKIVWGCECWWDKESIVKKDIEQFIKEGFVITEVDIEEVRKKYD